MRQTTGTAPPDPIRFRVLGELAVRSGGSDLPLPGPTGQAVLGVLLLTPGATVADERLLDLAWGPEKGSRRALQCTVSRVRAWLDRHAGAACRLERTAAGYRLQVPEQSVDLTRFQRYAQPAAAGEHPVSQFSRLSAALDEWRGPVLGGRPEWLSLDPVVRAIEQARVDSGCRLADLALRLDRAGEAVPRLADLAVAAPYDEPVQARLVRLLHAIGRPAEAARQVARVRQRFADDLGVAPSAEVRDAHAAGLRGAVPAVPVPAQLPPDVPDFTGRCQELQMITELVRAGGGNGRPAGGGSNGGPAGGGGRPAGGAVPVVAIAGMGGVGKSTLAVHAAHRLAAGFDGGQLYVDLRGGGDRSADPSDVLAWFLGALGVDRPAIPESIEERVALYRSRTAGRRVLAVVDNATDEGQVRPLIPGSTGCAVLVTSRATLIGLAAAHLIELDRLPPAAAVTLLGRIAGRGGLAGEPAAAEIVRRCDYLPLAIRIAGSQLAARPQWSLARLAAALGDEDRRLDQLAADDVAVRASLAVSYRRLAPAHRRAFQLLGLLGSADFPAWAAGAVLDLCPAVAEAYLESLVAAKLVTASGEDAAGQLRYHLPDLVRLYARECAHAESPAEVRKRAARRANDLLARGASRLRAQ
jgi:DNA-binding SARP family transcriptional activator